MMKTEYPASSRAFLYIRILYSNSRSQIALNGISMYEAQLGAVTIKVALTIILIECAGWPALTCSLQNKSSPYQSYTAAEAYKKLINLSYRWSLYITWDLSPEQAFP